MNRSNRAQQAQNQTGSEMSRLISLPPELRNLIYACVAQTSESVTFRDNQALYTPALSLVCQQIREEYRQIYLDEAPRYATRIKINVTNFITCSKGGGPVSSIHDHLPPAAEETERSWTVRIIVTNLWDRHRLELRNFIEHGDDLLPKYELEIVWDPKTFDAEFLRENVQRLRFCFGRQPERPNIWLQVEKALQEAFDRYTSSKPSVTKRNKRKKAEIRNSSKKKQKRA